MAMIECGECHAEISSNATACPKCGNPQSVGTLEKPTKPRGFVSLLLVACSVVFVILIVVANSPSESYEARDARYQAAKQECGMTAAKAVINESSPPFTQERGDLALKLLKECMTSKGFGAEMK